MTSTALVDLRKHLGRGGALCKEFNRVRMNSEMDWRTEQAYAMAIIRDSEALQECEPHTIGRSLVDLGVMGLSLSPALKEAYLIPYKGVCTASPSYMGLEQIAYRTGLVEMIQTKLVRRGDKFREWTDDNGTHIQHAACAPSGAEVTHAYCIAFLTSGRKLVEVMDQRDLAACRDAAAHKNRGKVPFVWKGPFRGEMYKKCVLRRAWKHFPRIKNPALVRMMEAVDRTDPMDFGGDTPTRIDPHGPNVIDPEMPISSDQINVLIDMMVEAGVDARAHDSWLSGLASKLGFPEGIRAVTLGTFDAAASTMEQGLKRWAESTQSSSHQSTSGQEDTTSQKEVA